MNQSTDLENWKRLLASIESADNRIDIKVYAELANLFQHLAPQTAPRVQREYESCTLKTEDLLSKLFDEIDLSDYTLLCSFLSMLRSFGYFRIAQITYHVEGPRDELNPSSVYSPNITKAKWYELCPLLPDAGTVGWKGIMNHGLVKEEHQLLQVCLQLLSQKLHFYTIVSTMSRFQDCSTIIRRNGEKVAEKLFELIRYVAYDDESIIGLDATLFNLLSPFTDEEQQSAIIDATVQDLFKPFSLQRPIRDEEISGIYELIDTCIMGKARLQNVLVAKLLEHLKCNVLRRKRRHSVEAIQENGSVTLESLLTEINNDIKLMNLLPKIDELTLSAKSLQTGYIAYWIKIIDRIMPTRTLTANNSLKIVGTCSIILASTSDVINHDLIRNISIVLAKTIENTGQSKLDKLFHSCDWSFMIELTKILSEKTQLTSTFDAPIQKFYKSYIDRFMRYCMMKNSKHEAENFIQFVNFICDKSTNKETSNLLQYIIIHELAQCLENFKNRASNKILESFMICARTCCKRLYKFIKRNLKNDLNYENGDDMDTSDFDGSSECCEIKVKKAIVVDTLVSTLRIAIERQDQELLDSYSELLLKIFKAMTSRIENLIKTAQTGLPSSDGPLDLYLPKLLQLYIEHNEMIQAYLNYDLVDAISLILIKNIDINEVSDEVAKVNKKLFYNQVKAKLEALSKRAETSMDVYPTIINKQYNSVVDQSIGSLGDIKKEKSCCHNYWRQMKIFYNISSIILNNCDPTSYRKVLNGTVHWLEHCDTLDHPKIMYLLLMLESLIPKQSTQAKDSLASQAFAELLPRISCGLIRITKSVELGPSIHAFTRSGAHRSNKGIQCCTYSNCIKIYTLIFLNYPSKITNPLITDAMQICIGSNLIQYAKYSDRMHKFFIQLASPIAGLLKSICIGKKEKEILRSSIPVFLVVFTNLIRCIILASDRQKLEVQPSLRMNGHGNDNGDVNNQDQNESIDIEIVYKNYETQLELLSMDIGRTLNNLSFLRVKLVDYAPHLICAYLKDIQRAACSDFVKIHLNEGIFRIFNLVDAHQKERQEEVLEAGVQRKTVAGKASGSLFDMIHARLDQASREIFRDMHENYNRFHRYQGKC